MPLPSAQLPQSRLSLTRLVPSRQAGASFDDSFSPLSLPGLLAWYSDTGYLQTAAGPVASADGDPIGQWSDQSGRVNHLLQAIAGKRFTLKLAIQNGRSIVRADGVSNFLKAVAFASNQPVWVFAALALRSTAGNAYLWDGNVLDQCSAYQSVAGGLRMFAGTNGPLLTLGTAWHTVSCWYSGAASEAHLDGAAAATGDTGAANPGGFELGAQSAGATGFSSLDVGELFIVSGSLSAARRAQAEAYLKARWATP
jgi:hypothetical protein